MTEIRDKAKEITDNAKQIAEAGYKYAVLTAIEKGSTVASSAIAAILVLVFSLFVLLFIGIALGWWLGEQMNNMLAGFSIVAGIFAALVVGIMLSQKKVLSPYLRNVLIKKLYEQ